MSQSPPSDNTRKGNASPARAEGTYAASWPAVPVELRPCVVVIAAEGPGGPIAAALAGIDGCRVVTYGRCADIAGNGPAGPVALAILTVDDSSSDVERAVGWLRHRWPRCVVAVVAPGGQGPAELAARRGGALFFTQPFDARQCRELINLGARLQTSDFR